MGSEVCRCHADDSLYGSLQRCPQCGHRSFEQMGPDYGACERRRCAYEAFSLVPVGTTFTSPGGHEMPYVTPSTRTAVELEDFEPYKVWLKDFDWSTGAAQYGSKIRLQVIWALDEEGDDTLWDWVNLALGNKQKSAEPSKFRELLNAFSGKPAETPITRFGDPDDSDDSHWYYEGSAAAYADLAVMKATKREVLIRGRSEPRSDGTGLQFRIKHYQAVKQQPAAGGKKKPAIAVVEDNGTTEVNPDEIPF